MATAEKILQTSDPVHAMTLSREIKNFDSQRWDKISYEIMKTACLNKFQQNPSLREELFKTIGAYLVEASEHSRIWGIGLAIDDPHIADPKKWRGSNKLGRVLMEVRDVLARQYSDEATRFCGYYAPSRK
ncbi:hypothetical protein AAVH_27241 [Aphelenchoides avenae]|nr:hypothetical protein AAVH_27241 [Aphelenchus avenae]